MEVTNIELDTASFCLQTVQQKVIFLHFYVYLSSTIMRLLRVSLTGNVGTA